MKPLRLTMEAFGPYAKKTVLDFRGLHGKPLVLIHGPTGGGKTAILDAMCFGLFGKTSGDERQGSDLRSDLADPSQLTRVTFDFLHGERVLRVVREPTQQKKKSRGDGFTEHKTQAWLWDQSSLATESPDAEGTLLAEKPKAVDAEVKSILGFTEEQFRQIVVLPQGKFRDFLSAPAKDKEKILKTLFGTSIYETITEELQKETRALESSFAANETRRKGILEDRGFENIEALEAAIETVAQALPTLRNQAQALSDQAKEAAAKLLQGQELNRKVEARIAAEAKLKVLEAHQKSAEEKKTRLSRILALKPLQPLNEALEETGRAYQEAELKEREAQDANTRAATQLQSAKAAASKEDADEGRARREEAQKRLTDLQSLQADVAAYQGAEAGHQAALEALHLKKSDEEKAADLLQRSRTKFTKLEEQAATLTQLEVGLVKARDAQSKHQDLVKALTQLNARRADLKRAETSLSQAKQAETKAKQDLATFLEHFKTLQLLWHQGQAARLAAELEQDAPCPVCGSHDHPSPAQNQGEDIPTDEALEEAEKAYDKAREALASAQQTLAARSSQVEAIASQVKEQRDALGEDANLSSEDLEARGQALQNAETPLAKAVDAAREAASALELGKTKMPGIETSAAEASTARQSAALALEKSKTELESLRSRLPETLRDPKVFNDALEEAKKAHEHGLTHYETVKAAEQAAEKAQALANADAANAAQRRADTKKALEELKTKLQAGRAEAGLSGDELYQVTLQDAHNESQLETDISNYQRDLNEARGELKQAQASAGQAKPLDLDGPTRESQEAQALAETKTKELHDAESNHQSLLTARETYHRLVEAGGKEAERYQAIAALSEAAAGKNARRLSLQRYVLASLLDDVLAHASERLRVMSTGRYRVLRDEALRDARQAGGLDLLIEDQYTGETRPISTLSGGESFQAALALSLGLADVIQALSGGIRVDALFIDEGFGTLDGEALERAIEELLKLRDGGRLVGIISHVTELRHRISSRIEVQKSERGSAISVHIGD